MAGSNSHTNAALRSRDINGKTIMLMEFMSGNVIKFTVVESDAALAQMYAEELRVFADYSGKAWQRRDNVVTIDFGNAFEAEMACQLWCG